MIGFVTQHWLLMLAGGFLVFVAVFAYWAAGHPDETRDLAQRRLVRWLAFPLALYAEHRGVRRWTTNVVGVLLFLWIAKTFSTWVQPALTPADLFLPPVLGPEAVRVEMVKEGPITRTVEYTGAVKPYVDNTVFARVDGYVSQLRVYPGDRVRRGQLLAQLETSDLTPQLDRAIADSILWRTEWERDSSLYENQGISASDRDRTRRNYEAAAAHTRHLRVQVGYATIRALTHGWVAERMVFPGQYVHRGEPMLRVDRLDSVRVQFDVSEADIMFIGVGGSVWLTMPQLPADGFNHPEWQERMVPMGVPIGGSGSSGGDPEAGRPEGPPVFGAAVTAIFPAADPMTRTVVVEVLIPNPGDVLRTNTYVVGRFVTKRSEQALQVPTSAVIAMPGGRTVVFVGPAFSNRGSVEMREVTLGLETDRYVEIRSGVQPMEFVVYRGGRSLVDGQEVIVVERRGGLF